MQTKLAHMLDTWMVRHEMLPRAHARNMAAVIARQCVHCSPRRHRGQSVALAEHWVAARLVAVIFCFEYPSHPQEGSDPTGQIRRIIDSARTGGATPPGTPWLLAISDLFLSLIGPERRDIEAFTAAFEDHVDAVLAMARMPAAGHGAGWQPARCCDAIDACLRLRPLLAGMEPYLRCWQTLLDCRPGPSFEQAVASLAPEVRRAHPHAGLDHALALASEGHAPGGRRRSPRLPEIDALAVVAIYLANDLASVARDRRSDGPDRDLNIVLLLERHFLAPAHDPARRWDDGASAATDLEPGEAATVGMYNVLVARFRALRELVVARDDSDDTSAYLLLLASAVDGHLQGLIELSAERLSTSSASAPAPGGQAIEPRYGSMTILKRLRFIDGPVTLSVEPSDGV